MKKKIIEPDGIEKTEMTFDESILDDKLKKDVEQFIREKGPGPKISLEALPPIDDVNCEATVRSTIRMDDTVLVPAVVYKFLTSHLEKTSMGSLMTMIQESKDLARMMMFFQQKLKDYSERAECGIMVAYQNELELETGITQESPIYELAIFMFYHLRKLDTPDELDYLYKYH